MFKKNIAFFILIISFHFLQAQNSSEDKLGTWYMYNGVHQLSKKIKLTTSAHFRYYEPITAYQQEIYRVGVNYTFTKKINITGGTVYSIKDVSYKRTGADLYEFRFYQDLNIKDKWGSFFVKHRVRLAQRFRRQNFANKTTHRIRYGLFTKYPISSKMTTYAFNEVFIKFAKKTFGENRTGFGILQELSKKVKLKAGYMFTKFRNSKSQRIQLGVILNTSHFKKEVS